MCNFSSTIRPRRLSFSGLGLLMSTPSPEKDSLLGPMVHKKIAHTNFEKGGFFLITLYFIGDYSCEKQYLEA